MNMIVADKSLGNLELPKRSRIKTNGLEIW